MRRSTMTGVLEASESSNPCSTMRTMTGRLGLGSSIHSEDFMAKACVRSRATLAPSPVSSPATISAPPITPAVDR